MKRNAADGLFAKPSKLGGRDVALQSFVDTYGYLAIMVGTFFEGETILVLGGFTGHPGCER